jgi:hypothetical protein
MHMSLISQVQDVFPELDEQFVSLCLRVFQNNYERVVDSILEGNLPPPLALRLEAIRNNPQRNAEDGAGGASARAGRGSDLNLMVEVGSSSGANSARRRDSTSSDSSSSESLSSKGYGNIFSCLLYLKLIS